MARWGSEWSRPRSRGCIEAISVAQCAEERRVWHGMRLGRTGQFYQQGSVVLDHWLLCRPNGTGARAAGKPLRGPGLRGVNAAEKEGVWHCPKCTVAPTSQPVVVSWESLPPAEAK
jgi:hypothetical protein